MKVHGHVLIWHSQLSSWVSGGSWTEEEAAGILEEHTAAVISRFNVKYPGVVVAWDVVNEAFSNSGSTGDNGFRTDSFWYSALGTEEGADGTVRPAFIEMAFAAAREAAPETVKLYYNDFLGEDMGVKSGKIYALVKYLRERELIDGVGLQMHLGVYADPEPADIRDNIKRLRALGLEVKITEMDYALKTPADSKSLEMQGIKYYNIALNAMADDGLSTLTVWGFTDRYSWIPSWFPGYGQALLYDEDMNRKPAYEGLARALCEQ